MKISESQFNALAELRGWNPEQRKKARDVLGGGGSASETIRGFAGIPAEAMTLGILGDEARAAGRAGIAVAADALTGKDLAGSFGEEFKLALADERRVEQQVYKDFPVTATAAQIAFGLVPSMKVAQAAGVGKSFAGGAARQGGAASVEGAVYGAAEGEGLEDRVSDAAKFGAISGAIAGPLGGIAGRSVGAIANEKAATDAALRGLEAARVRLATSEEPGVFKDIVDGAKRRMDVKALRHLNMTGDELTGEAFERAFKETANDMGLPLRRLRQAQEKTGEGLNYLGVLPEDFIQEVERFVPGKMSAAKKGWAKRQWQDKITPIVKKAEQVVGPKFAGQMQSYATKVAQNNDRITTLYNDKAVQAFQRVIKNDLTGSIRQSLLNMSNVNLKEADRLPWMQKLAKDLRTADPTALEGFVKLRSAVYAQQIENSKNVNSHMLLDSMYIPANFKAEASGITSNTASRGSRETNAMAQKRGVVTGEQAMMYENPSIVIDDWLRVAGANSLMMSHFNLRNLGAVTKLKAAAAGKPYDMSKEALKKEVKNAQKEQAAGLHMFDELATSLKMKGAHKDTARHASELMRSLVVNGGIAPSATISNFRKAAYIGAIGNPYAAVLSLGDVFNSAINFGALNTMRALPMAFRKEGSTVTVADVGLMHQSTGEFLRDGVGLWQDRFNKVSEGAFKVSGFRMIDQFGKNTSMNAAMLQNKQLANKGYAAFDKRWRGVFKREEIPALYRDVLAGNKSPGFTQMAAAELSKMQPTDLASLPQWYLDNPNARVLYMLRTFALKQLQQMETLVYRQWEAGNKKEATKNALAYLAVVGGGNAVIQEGRQAIKGDQPTVDGIGMRWVDHMLGATSANALSLYNVNRSRAEDNPVFLASGLVPPIGLVFAPLVDLMQIAEADSIDLKEAIEESETFGWLPFGRLIQDWMKDGD